MAKRVLIIEQSLAVRGVAESLLRQNGFDVVSADSPSGAMEILDTSKVDLILVSSEITVESGQPLYEQFGAEKSSAAVPIVILHDPNSGPDPGYPPESIIAKPFTPRDFLAAIGPFVGSEQTVSAAEHTPFSGADVEEALIDSALGLDKIEVNDAEIMQDDSGAFGKQKRKGVTESLIGYDIKVNPDDTTKAVRGKIESIDIPAEGDDVSGTPPGEEQADSLTQDDSDEPPADSGMSDSSEIEIITDQYGIVAIPETADLIRPEEEDKAHDYEWFLSELRREAAGEKRPESPGETPMGPQVSLDEKAAKAPGSPKSKTTSEKKPQAKKATKEQPTHGEAIDRFISEFKKEVDKITGDTSAQIPAATIAADDSEATASGSSGDLKWEERLEKIPEDQIKLISGEIVAAVADRVAKVLISRIDPNVVYGLIKAALDTRPDRQEKKTVPKT